MIASAPAPGAWALILASLLWGTTGTAASFLPDDVSPLAVGASTMTMGGILLFAIAAKAAIASLRDAATRRWLLVGSVGVFVYPLAFYSSMNLAGVAIGNVVSLGTGPVFAAILEWAFERRRPSRLWAVCTATAVAGIVLLAWGSDHGDSAPVHPANPDTGAGIALGLLAGFAYALYTYSSSRAIRSGATSSGAMGGMFGLGAIALAPVLLLLGGPLLQSSDTIAIAAYLALGPMFVAYVFFGVALRTLTSSTATSITLLEPFVATLLAVVVVGERLLVAGWIGLALVLVPVVVLATARQKRVEPLSP
ncbi:EamA family transporter [Salinibacterium sp. G-O1]|uniref:DMT family transporter n=1 Tax=Salinibacterium sp. G-O1 TaxID=3046208 RepID=UPI0024B8DA00|nr:EamA family transporter [Salinibacterium sp. G-O1]MDJ0335289.1 EamA family transporter [Salinibacterium sp. G-O1]